MGQLFLIPLPTPPHPQPQINLKKGKTPQSDPANPSFSSPLLNIACLCPTPPRLFLSSLFLALSNSSRHSYRAARFWSENIWNRCVGNALFGWIVNYNRTRACRKLNLRACYCQTALAYNLSQLAGNKARWLNILKSDFPSPPLVLFPSSCTCMCTCRCQALSFSGSAHHRQVWSTKELYDREQMSKLKGTKISCHFQAFYNIWQN